MYVKQEREAVSEQANTVIRYYLEIELSVWSKRFFFMALGE